MRKLIKTAIFSATLLAGSLFGATALEDGNYTLKVFKIGSDGVVASEANATGTGTISDGSGKLKDINISGLPTNSECNFIATELYRVDGDTTVDMNRSSIAPCPTKDGTVELGLNSLSSNQMIALKDLGSDIGSDDPITYAFGLLITRIGDLNSTDLETIAEMAKQAVSGESNSSNSFTNILKSQLKARGKSDSEIDTTLDSFRSNILYNSSTETVDGNSIELNLGGFTRLYKNAVDSSSSSDANASMGKAGGLMGKIFVAAGNAASIPIADIVYGLSASGDVATPLMNDLSSAKQTALNATFGAFQRTLEGYATKTDYSNAFGVLGADSGIISQFGEASDEYIKAQTDLDIKYSSYFLNGDINSTIATEINTAYNTIFTNLLKGLESNATVVDDTNTSVYNGIMNYMAKRDGKSVSQLDGTTIQTSIMPHAVPSSISYPDANGSSSSGNITINQATVMDKVGDWLGKLGKLVYTRVDINASQMSAINSYVGHDVNESFADINSSENITNIAKGTYTVSSPTETQEEASQTVLTTMRALASIQNDIMIVSANKWCQQDEECNGTGQTEAQKTFGDYLDQIADNITGYSDCETDSDGGLCITGATELTDAQKKAIVQLMMMP